MKRQEKLCNDIGNEESPYTVGPEHGLMDEEEEDEDEEPVRDHCQDGSVTASNATVSSLEEHCVNAMSSAREKVVDGSTRAELVTVPKITAKVEDHSCTWRDVVIKGIKKKDALQS